MRSYPRIPGTLLFGNLRELRADRLALLLRAPQQYGPLARMRMATRTAWLASAPSFAHAVLVEHADAFQKGLGLSIFAKPLLGEGLLTSEGALHRRQRRLLAPAFMHKRISRYAVAFGQGAERSRQRIVRRAELDLSEELMRLTFEVVGETLFDAQVGKDAETVGQALTEAMREIIAQLHSPLPPGLPTPSKWRLQRAVRRLDHIVYALIRERRQSSVDRGDVLSMLLLAQDPEDEAQMADRQVRDEVMTMMLAGHETTANALSWTFDLLARHAPVRERLEAELDRVLGGRVPVLEDLTALPYTLQVFKEAMRLYPPAYMVSRRAMRDVTIDGALIRAGEVVLVNILGIQRDPKHFPRPEAFLPERFAPEASESLHKGAYLPFGGGPRVCIGNHFALMEGQILLAHLAQHFRFAPISERPTELEALITLRPKGGLPMRVSPRSARPAFSVASGG